MMRLCIEGIVSTRPSSAGRGKSSVIFAKAARLFSATVAAKLKGSLSAARAAFNCTAGSFSSHAS